MDHSGSRRAMLVLLLASLGFVALVLRPLAEAILVGAVLAAVTNPLHARLVRAFGGRRATAAAVVVFLLVLVLGGPLAALTVHAGQQALEAFAFVSEAVQSRGTEELLAELPAGLQRLVRSSLGAAPGEPLGPLLGAKAGESGGDVVRWVQSAASATGSILYHTTMALIATYGFLSRGPEAIDWIDATSPLREDQTRELLAEVHKVAVSIVRTAILTAGVQAMAALVGYLLVGVPSAIFFTTVTFVFAMVPAIGGAAGTLVTAALVFATGQRGAALFLVAWALLVVGLVDNVAKPLLLRHDVGHDSIVILFSLLGGIVAFGAVGLILGPLSVAFFLAVLRIWERDYGGPPPTG